MASVRPFGAMEPVLKSDRGGCLYHNKVIMLAPKLERWSVATFYCSLNMGSLPADDVRPLLN